MRAKATRHFTPRIRKKLEKQVKNLAWYIAQNHMERPTLVYKVKGHLIKHSKKIIKHSELSGIIVMGDRTVDFVISNPFQFNYKMVACVHRNGKNAVTFQGSLQYCFDMLAAFKKDQ